MASRTISGTAEELIPQNALRRSLFVQNEDSAINVFLKWELPGATSVSTTDHDIILAPSSSLILNTGLDGDRQLQGRWTIVAASGTPRIAVFETEEYRR